MRIKKAPNVFIGIPTYSGKNYCLSEFFKAVHDIEYPKELIKLVVVDNTFDNGESLRELFPFVDSLPFSSSCIPLPPSKMSENTMDRLCNTHEYIRQLAIQSKADYLLHLESDILINPQTLKKLIFSRKKMVSPMYMITSGASRHLVVRNIQQGVRRELAFRYLVGHYTQDFVDGSVKEIISAGLGCCLIHKDIVKAVPFRYDYGDYAPDTVYTQDVYNYGFKNHVDTSEIVYHMNNHDWGRNVSEITEKIDWI